MTILKQNKIPMILGTAILSIAIAFGGTVFASHSFEAGTAGGTLPDNTHIRLDGITLSPATISEEDGSVVTPGTIFPLYDSSPNYVSGHILLKAPCELAQEDEIQDTYRPTVTLVAGHVDEFNANTHMQKVPLYYIGLVSNAPTSCIWHAHIPDPVNGGAPRVTDIDLVNLSDQPIEFGPGDVVDINIQRVLGNIASDKYTDGPFVDFLGPGTNGDNPVYNLNDSDHANDGLGHTP